MERFAPTVQIDGKTYTPDGWMWIMGFAIGGCEWAIRETEKPEFQQAVRDYLEEEHNQNIRDCIQDRLKEIERLEEELRP